MRRERKLMILTGVLVVCVAGAFGISRIDFEEKMTGTETTFLMASAAQTLWPRESCMGVTWWII